jgi:predicted HTH domain antitoxin
MKRTNIMLTDDQHRRLKSSSRREGRTLGELVRGAVDAAFEKKDPIEHRKRIALEAYKEGFVSLGKLAETLGVDIVSARLYLKEQNMPIWTQELHEINQDAVNA